MVEVSNLPCDVVCVGATVAFCAVVVDASIDTSIVAAVYIAH